MKRVMSLILALIFTLSVSRFTAAFAVTPDVPVFEVSSAALIPGKSADIDIYIRNNPGLASVKISVSFDNSLVLNSVTYGGALGGICQETYVLSSPVILNWITLSPCVGDVLFATLRFTVSAEASLGDKLITITFDPDDVCGIDENSLDFDVQNGKIEVINCPHNNTEIRNAIRPTNAHKGYTGDTYCLDCDRMIAEGEDIYAPGDANIDGVVDVKDLVRIRRYLSDNSVEISEYADISGNGVILPNDLICTRFAILEVTHNVYEPSP